MQSKNIKNLKRRIKYDMFDYLIHSSKYFTKELGWTSSDVKHLAERKISDSLSNGLLMFEDIDKLINYLVGLLANRIMLEQLISKRFKEERK